MLDTKSKIDFKVLRTLGIVLLVGICLVWWLDNVLDTMVANWAKSAFITSYIDENGLKQDYFHWPNLRAFLITIGFFVLVFGFLAAHYYIQYTLHKERSNLQNQLITYLDHPETNRLDDSLSVLESKVLNILMDAKHQRALYEKEAERKNDLITYLAHDLKTPLASVIGYLSFLSEAQELPLEHRQKYTDIALNKAYRLEDLINQFFDITRFNLQTIVIQRERIDIRMMLEQLREEFYPMIQKKQGSIRIALAKDALLYVDPDKFGRVLNNVLKNAVTYCYENSEILIKETIEEEILIIQIINEGNQIPENKLAMIFEKFYRMDEARSTQQGGSGLGLAIAKEIMEAHQGSISVSSDETHTTFTIKVPIKERKSG